jgi:hypothetical protein
MAGADRQLRNYLLIFSYNLSIYHPYWTKLDGNCPPNNPISDSPCPNLRPLIHTTPAPDLRA